MKVRRLEGERSLLLHSRAIKLNSVNSEHKDLFTTLLDQMSERLMLPNVSDGFTLDRRRRDDISESVCGFEVDGDVPLWCYQTFTAVAGSSCRGETRHNATVVQIKKKKEERKQLLRTALCLWLY